jgi:hypothetical protein
MSGRGASVGKSIFIESSVALCNEVVILLTSAFNGGREREARKT